MRILWSNVDVYAHLSESLQMLFCSHLLCTYVSQDACMRTSAKQKTFFCQIFGGKGMIQTTLCVCPFDERQTVSGCKSGAIYFWEEGKAVRYVHSIGFGKNQVSHSARNAYATIAIKGEHYKYEDMNMLYLFIFMYIKGSLPLFPGIRGRSIMAPSMPSE